MKGYSVTYTMRYEHIKRYKKCSLFAFASSISHSFTFNSRFLHEMKLKVGLFKIICGIPVRFNESLVFRS